MRRTKMAKTNLEARFTEEKMDDKKLNFLKGGDGDGGQGGVIPWE